MNILSIDPGETSAFVDATLDSPSHPHPHLRVLQWGTWSGMEELAYLYEAKLFYHPDAIVIEDYRIYPTKAKEHIGSQVYTAKEIGRIEWLAFQNDTEVVYQLASQAKGRWPTSRMKMYPMVARFLPKVKGYAVPHRKHLLDAYRHLLTFVEIRMGLQFLEVNNA